MMNIAWINSIPPYDHTTGVDDGEQLQNQRRGKVGSKVKPAQPPNSALSLMRELKYDTYTSQLVSNPLPELSLLHIGSLVPSTSRTLLPGKLVTLPLVDKAAGAEIDLNVSFVLKHTGTTSFGVSVLANKQNLSESAVVRINVTADHTTGDYRGTVTGAIEPKGGTGQNTPGTLELVRWNGSFLLSRAAANEIGTSTCGGSGVACVDVRVLVDRSIVLTPTKI